MVAVKKLGHDAVTNVEIAWRVPTPSRPLPVLHTLPPPLPTRPPPIPTRTVQHAVPPPPRRMPMATPPRPPVFASGTVTAAKRYDGSTGGHPSIAARPGVMTSGVPSMTDLTALAKAIANESSFDRAAIRLQHEACRLARAAEALCVVFDWPRRAAWTVQGPIANESVKELIAQVAGSGHRSILGNALLEPIGPAPSRAVLALRKPTGATFSVQEVAMISTLALGLASSIDRLISRR